MAQRQYFPIWFKQARLVNTVECQFFSNLQGERKMWFKKFDSSRNQGVKLQYLTKERETAFGSKKRIREIRIPL